MRRWGRARGVLAALGVLGALGALGALGGCEQLMIQNVNQVSDEASRGDVYERTLAIAATPALWAALSARAASLRTEGWDQWAWSGGVATLALPDGAEVSLGPLDATFDIQGVTVEVPAGGGALRATVGYRAPFIPARLLYRDASGSTQLCRLDLNLRLRQVVLDLVPSIGPQGQPIWAVGASNGLSGDERLIYQLTEPCSLDLEGFDWAALSAQVTGALSAHLQQALVPGLREGLVAALGLPAGSVSLSRGQGGFFAQQPMTLSNAVSDGGPWNGAAFDVTASGWLRLALDIGMPAPRLGDFACGAPLPTALAPAPLLPADLTPTTPSGDAYHVLWRVDAGLLAAFFERLLGAGALCADLTPSTRALSAFSLLAAPITGLSDAVRLRVQPLAPLALAVAGPHTLRLEASLRLELFGVLRDTTLRWAALDVAIAADLTPTPHDAFGMRFDIASLSTQATAADVTALQSLNPAAVDLRRLADVTVRFLLEEHLRWPLVRAFGQRLEVVELSAAARDLSIYLRLLTP